MRIRVATAAAALLAVAVLLSFAGPAWARHLASPFPKEAYDPPLPNEIPLLVLCGGGPISYPAGTGFVVLGGWFWVEWKDATPADKRAFMSPGTTTDFSLDGVLQKTSMMDRHAKTFTIFGVTYADVKLKLVVWEHHNGLSGTHGIRGEWFFDGALEVACDLTVNFT